MRIKDFTHRTSHRMHQFYWNVAEKKHFRAQADPNPENKQTLILSGFLKQLDNNFTRSQAQ